MFHMFQTHSACSRKIFRTKHRSRKGATLILAVALMFLLFSFLAFSVDTGYLSQSRAEIRRTADAAAMAGCWELYSELEEGIEGQDAYPSVRLAAASMASSNSSLLTTRSGSASSLHNRS